MPTYDYVCGACGHRLEVRHAIGVQGPTQCPNCHSHALRKAIAAPAIVFKGSGWAKKDRGSSRPTRAAAAGNAGADAGRTSGAGDASGTSRGDGDASPSARPSEPSGGSSSGGSSGASAAADAD
jgi:putative FmdB family regulatory protein